MSRSLSLSLSLLATVLTLTACGAPSYDVEVAPAKRNCVGVAESLCLETTIDGESSLFYSSIEGFSYQWCRRHLLRVHEEPVPNPPADGSSIRYVLDEEVEVTEVPGHEMTLTLFDEWSDGEEIAGLGFTPRCSEGDDALCLDLFAALADGDVDRVEASFRCEAGEDAPRLLSFAEPAAQ